MELTAQIWKDLGFKRQQSLGGFDRYYHNVYLGKDFNFYNGGASISDGHLSFDCNNENNPKTLKELYELMVRAFEESFKEQGIKEAQYKIQNALGIGEL